MTGRFTFSFTSMGAEIKQRLRARLHARVDHAEAIAAAC
jgi:hypothetical protein